MNKLAVLLITLLLGACAQPPGADAPSSQQTATSNVGEAQNRARIHTELAADYFTRRQYAIALEELRDAIRADSRYAPAYNMFGLVYMELHEDKTAENNFRRALELAPNESETHNNYGWFLCTRNRFEPAIAQFNEALRNPLYPSPERALTNAGVCSLKAGNQTAAEAYFERALKRQPNQPQALAQLADIYYRQGRYPESRVLLARFFDVSQPSPAPLWLGVRLARKMGDRDAEASYGLQLRRRFADSPETHLLLNGQYE
ncbi:type IV pilus biogenesis/stability protein PilW [Sulfuriferula plumbiphila]|uniref:Type IV pilus biogenesis/stability protein PilW n=1 Tax=Sulfuriferula plumbiphila TaxID=171865 RepID=A0A512L5K4_9PROT|nr:type IV pilus biogenesis/stability protein PilW [Sulfuriferula plumbiphila]BBP03472.1 type IV pilus biogenesis/stability protein PilW [Sulfuriferula plumbiphila]GEP29757.1 type IV pilus biogenesis/stability protein PilW [Sulfuriferula plumbiphila]